MPPMILYCCALGAAAAATLLAYVPPYLLRAILDSGVLGAPWTLPAGLAGVGPTLAVLAAAALLSALFAFAASYGTQKAAEEAIRRLRERLFGHIQRLPFETLSAAPAGDWVQRCTSDVDTVRRLAALQLPELVNNAFQALWALPILFTLQPDLAWTTVPLLPVVLALSLYFFQRIQASFQQSDESEGRLSGILQENITGVRVVKAFARQAFETERFGRENARYRKVTARLINLFALYWGTVNLLSMVQVGLVLVVGIGFVHEGRASVGTVVMFLTMTGMLVWPIRQLGRVLTDMGKARVSWRRIQEILRLAVEDPGLPWVPAHPWQGRVEFRHVSVRRAGRALLEDVSFTLEPGAHAALLGATGSGKSTLVQVLAGLLPYEGEVLLDGQELRGVPPAEWRRQVGLVLQEPWLFAKTIGENIALAHEEVQQAEIEAAAAAAQFDQGIRAFPQGYETLLGERGVTLSGGQRQRTAIAQMLVRPRPVLIFDDSLSAVDNHTDAAIRAALARRQPRATVVLISHRLTSLAGADLILVLDQGRLVQQGTHAALVQVPGPYRRMAELQNALQNEVAP